MNKLYGIHHLKNKINQIISPIFMFFEDPIVDVCIFIQEDLTSLVDTKDNLPNIEIDQLNMNELELFNIQTTGNREQKYYAAAKLSSSTTGKPKGYFAIAKSDYSKFNEYDLNLLNTFVSLINETVADFEHQSKLMDILNDFIHKSVHDLKNPLTSISLTSELLKRKTDDPATIIKFAEKLENASKRVFDNLDHLKSVFPADDKSFKLNINQVDLNQLLKEATAAKYLNFSCINEKTLIYADADRLRNAFDCLIVNAASKKEEAVTLETIDDQIIIKLKHYGTHYSQHTKFVMAKVLIGMHKGAVSVTEDCYYISLPFETP